MAAKKKSKSKNITVQFARLSEQVKEVTLPAGSDVKDLLEAVEIGEDEFASTLEGMRINGETVSLSTKLKNGGFYTYAPKVVGGSVR